MSQRTEHLNEKINIALDLKVTLKRLSNHNGFFDGQVVKSTEEFKEVIKEDLIKKVCGEYSMEEILFSVDFVDYDVEPNGA